MISIYSDDTALVDWLRSDGFDDDAIEQLVALRRRALALATDVRLPGWEVAHWDNRLVATGVVRSTPELSDIGMAVRKIVRSVSPPYRGRPGV